MFAYSDSGPFQGPFSGPICGVRTELFACGVQKTELIQCVIASFDEACMSGLFRELMLAIETIGSKHSHGEWCIVLVLKVKWDYACMKCWLFTL